MLSKYLKPVISFKDLPDDLKNAIFMRGLVCTMIGIFVLAVGISSHNLFFGGIAALTELFLLFYFLVPYFLSTRDRIIQIAGICVSKDIQGYMLKSVRFHFLRIQVGENSIINVCVNKKIYRQINTKLPVFVYVLPKNILPKDNCYLINDPLFVLQPEVLDEMPEETNKQGLKK